MDQQPKPSETIAVPLDAALVEEVDVLVRQHRYADRREAIESAVAAGLARLRRTRLADACAQLDPAEERRVAEEGLAADLADWPE